MGILNKKQPDRCYDEELKQVPEDYEGLGCLFWIFVGLVLGGIIIIGIKFIQYSNH